MLACQPYPLLAAAQTSVERRLEYKILRTDGGEQLRFILTGVDADEFLVERDGNRRCLTESRHLLPLSRADGLLNAVDMEGRKALEFLHGLVGMESPVGIYAQLDAVGPVLLAEGAKQFEFALEIQRADFHLDAAEAACQFLLHALQHCGQIAHPHKAVDRDARFAAVEGRIVEAER